MTATLALLRHGETIWTRDKRVQGRTDVPLSESGYRALSACRLPPPWAAVQQVLTSPLARCRQTATALGLTKAAVEPRLVEMDWGQWEGRRLADLRAELGSQMADNEARGFDFQPAGGESPRMVLARIRPWLRQQATAGSATVAISHRGVIRVIFALATGWDMLGRPPAKLDWSALHAFSLAADGMPSVLQLNMALDSGTASDGGALP
ncbi:MAG TPA: histidine phosphatase family protein [Burkholderiaceae bacterium]|nr:histidine phosphatase family protein [Rhodoferax sp.]HQX58558.1 histidine phosphatase family protein [Burkholderiaceae bacterium]HQZ06016.1 histidine phosphatase family protein [Burkholderiaceae bacterium]